MSNEVEIVVRSTDKTDFSAPTRGAKEYGKGLEAVGEHADKSEQRIVGMKDTVDGVATIMQGPGKAGIAAYIQGWADLASGIANFVIPAMQSFTIANIKNVASTVWSKTVMIATSVATKAWAAAQWLLNAALEANPIGLVIVAVAALVAGIIYAYKHSETFRKIVQAAGRAAVAAFGWVLDKVQDLIGWIRSHWPLLLAILTGPIGLAVRWIIQHWDRITSTAKSIPGKIGRALSGVYNTLTAPFRNAIQAVQSWLDGLMGKIRNVGSSLYNNTIGRLPGFAHGGIVGAAGGGPRSNLVEVGEHGRELVRLPFGSTVMSNPDSERFLSGSSGGGTLQIELVGGSDDLLMQWLRRSIRIRAGNGSNSVQTALGGA